MHFVWLFFRRNQWTWTSPTTSVIAISELEVLENLFCAFFSLSYHLFLPLFLTSCVCEGLGGGWQFMPCSLLCVLLAQRMASATTVAALMAVPKLLWTHCTTSLHHWPSWGWSCATFTSATGKGCCFHQSALLLGVRCRLVWVYVCPIR